MTVQASPSRSEERPPFERVRALSLALAAPLSDADATVQSMDDASPAKWHLAHTSWFFETFVLRGLPGYEPFDPAYAYLFNSYYEAEGPRHARPKRGLLTRPSLDEIRAWRAHVDAAVAAALPGLDPERRALVELGCHHEQQHQELLLTDILHLFAQNPLAPALFEGKRPPAPMPGPLRWIEGRAGVVEIGHDSGAFLDFARDGRGLGGPACSNPSMPSEVEARTNGSGSLDFARDGRRRERGERTSPGFAFDCEGPRHPVLLHPHALADRPVTAGEWIAFIEAGGYAEPRWWLSDGWAWVQAEGIEAPLYWRRDGEGGWLSFGLDGLKPVDRAAPVSHISFYEADAFAAWAGARLPTEAEWESAAAGLDPHAGNQLDGPGPIRPRPGDHGLFGGVWEWTGSAYRPYPGFRPAEGAVGEYNGKFMSGQFVLKGGSCATPRGHMRASYRNFFYPHQRWQFTGVRLARDP